MKFLNGQMMRTICLTWMLLWSANLLPHLHAQPAILPIGKIRAGRPAPAASYDIEPALAGKTVRIQGVIHQKLLWPGSDPARPNHAFLIQNLPSDSDRDPATSDGLFVYTGKESMPMLDGRDPYQPRVGDLVVLEGRVGHRYGQTDLSRPRLVRLIRRKVDVPQVLPSQPWPFHTDLDQARRALEPLEGMRVHLPAGAWVQAGTQIYGGGDEAYIWLLPAAHPVAMRRQPFHRRVFRDPHPLDDVPDRRFDNGNGARIQLGSHGLKAVQQDLKALLPYVRTGDRLMTPIRGGVLYSYGHYKVMPDEVPQFQTGSDPSANRISGLLAPHQDHKGIRMVTYNIENLYDHRNDPSDPCDAVQDPGNATIRPPFGYLPPSESAYRNRLKGFALQIVKEMRSPEIFLLQEVEDQDILSFSNGSQAARIRHQPDGFPDVLQELALAIEALGGPAYACAVHRQGADTRGIVCAYFFRKDKVRLRPMGARVGWEKRLRRTFSKLILSGQRTEAEPMALQSPRLNPDADGDRVYARAAQVARFEWISDSDTDATSAGKECFIINLHFASRPQNRVDRRREQALLAAELGAALAEAFPHAGVVLGGDLNVFPRPDDPHPESPTDQLASIYQRQMQAVYEWVLSNQPANAYSYIYEGQAQTLDHLFLLGKAVDWFEGATFLHLNSDWPDTLESAVTDRGISDHDPLLARFRWE